MVTQSTSPSGTCRLERPPEDPSNRFADGPRRTGVHRRGAGAVKQLVRATLVLVFTIGILATGCASHAPKASTPKASPRATRSAKTPVSDIVGRWTRVTTCRELTHDLQQAGLGGLTPYAWPAQTSSSGQSSFRAGSPRPTRAHPCTGALPRKHSHLFTTAGGFTSLDWLGGQVDSQQYSVTGHTVRIGAVTFHYRIAHNSLRLTPVLTKVMIRKALAQPKKFSDAGWAVSVAYPGQTWKCG